MTTVKLIYNPYTLNTALLVRTSAGENAFTEDSSMAFIFDRFMGKWLEPNNSWKGFFAELSNAVGDNILKIVFVGTVEDFEDLTEAASRAEKNQSLTIEIEHLNGDKIQNELDAHKKLHALIDFLNTSSTLVNDSFLADIRPALKKVLSNKIKVNIISTVQNFSVQNIFQKAVANSELNFIISEPSQDLAFKLFNAFAEVDRNMILFVFNRKTISSNTVIEALRNVTHAIGQDGYAQTIYESLFFVCTDCEKSGISVKQIKNILSSCGFEEPKLFMVSSEFAELLLTKNFEQENFIAYRKVLSDTDCKNFLHAPIPSTLKSDYAERIEHYRKVLEDCATFLKYYNLHSPREITEMENRRNDALNEIALINSNLPTLEQTILTYAKCYVLPLTVRKIYLGVKKKLSAAERELDRKISDAEESLQRLREKISAFNRHNEQRNLHEKFSDTTVAVRFENARFEQLSRKLSDELVDFKAPEPEDTVDKNIVGHTETYIKLDTAQFYSQLVNTSLKKRLAELVDESAAYLTDNLLTPSRNAVAKLNNADKDPFQKLMADFEKILNGRNFDVPPMDFESVTVSSYEKTTRGRFNFVKYVPVEEIIYAYRNQGNLLLKEQLRQFKTAAKNFVANFQAQFEMNLKPITPKQNNVDRELQQLRQGATSKEKSIVAYRRSRVALKNFLEKLNSLLEMNP